MEEDKIIISNEENNYEAVDIIEDSDEVTYDETIQMIEVDEPELYTVDTDHAFAPLGESNEQLNHALLHNRDLHDQHTIGSITGLRQELDEIEALKTVESDKRGMANYYMWKDEQSMLPKDNRIGYFVSIHTIDHKVSICNNKNEIFGVTVDSAGFVGWQDGEEDRSKNENFALVANTGVVKVRCEGKVVAGNYVMSNQYGQATRSKSGTYGYYVISIDFIDGVRHAVISLDSTMNQVYKLSEDVVQAQKDITAVEIRANAAINTATQALKETLEPSINSALQNSQNALNNIGPVLDDIEDFRGSIDQIAGMQAQIDAIDESVVRAAQDAAKEAVDGMIDSALDAYEIAKELRNEIDAAKATANQSLSEVKELSGNLTSEFARLESETDEAIGGIATSVSDNSIQTATILKYISNKYEILETWENDFGKETSTIYFVEDESLYYYFDINEDKWLKTTDLSETGLSEAIVSFRETIEENQATIEGLTSYSGRDCVVVKKWDRYVWVADKFDSSQSDPFLIYYSNETKEYYQCDLTANDDPWKVIDALPEGFTLLKDEEQNNIYYAEDTKLYYYYDNGWKTTHISSVLNLVKSIAVVRQTADANSAKIEEILSYEGSDSDTLTSIRSDVEANKATISQLTSYIQNNYIKLKELWDETKRTEEDQDKIFYAQDSDGTWKYWYYKKDNVVEPGWYSSVNPSDAGLIESLASVQQQVTDNEASITELLSTQSETNTAIIELQQSVNENGALVESLAMNISKYTVGEYSQAYGLTLEKAMELLRDGSVFVPTENVSESYNRLVELNEGEEWEEEGKNTHLIYGKNTNGTWRYWYHNEDTNEWTQVSSIDTFTLRDFLKGYYYTWDKINGIWVVNGDSGGVNFTTEYIRGTNTVKYMVVENYEYIEINGFWNTRNKSKTMVYYAKNSEGNYKYWYWVGDNWKDVNTFSETLYITIPTKVSILGNQDTMYYVEDEKKYYFYHDNEWILAQNPAFEIGALYYWNTENEERLYWQKVATVESNTLNRAISQVRQSITDTSNEFSVKLTNAKNDLVESIEEINDQFSGYVTTTTFDENMSKIEQKTDDNEATLSLLVAKGIKTIDTWVEKEREEDDKDTVFYVTSEKKYYYWDTNTWVKTDVTDSHITSKINSAGIITAINNSGDSEMKISASRVEIDTNQLFVGKPLTGSNLIKDGSFDNADVNWVVDGSTLTSTLVSEIEEDIIVSESNEVKINQKYISLNGNTIYTKSNKWACEKVSLNVPIRFSCYLSGDVIIILNFYDTQNLTLCKTINISKETWKIISSDSNENWKRIYQSIDYDTKDTALYNVSIIIQPIDYSCKIFGLMLNYGMVCFDVTFSQDEEKNLIADGAFDCYPQKSWQKQSGDKLVDLSTSGADADIYNQKLTCYNPPYISFLCNTLNSRIYLFGWTGTSKMNGVNLMYTINEELFLESKSNFFHSDDNRNHYCIMFISSWLANEKSLIRLDFKRSEITLRQDMIDNVFLKRINDSSLEQGLIDYYEDKSSPKLLNFADDDEIYIRLKEYISNDSEGYYTRSPNLILDYSFYNLQENWNVELTSFESVKDGGYDDGRCIKTRFPFRTKERFLVNPKTNYMLSYYYQGNVKAIVNWYKSDGSSSDQIDEIIPEELSTDKIWLRANLSIKSPSDAKYADVVIVPINNNEVFVDGVMLEESVFLNPYSPHINESYSKFTTIDSSGLSVYDGNIKIYNKYGDVVFEGDTEGNLQLSSRPKNGVSVAGKFYTRISGGSLEVYGVSDTTDFVGGIYGDQYIVGDEFGGFNENRPFNIVGNDNIMLSVKTDEGYDPAVFISKSYVDIYKPIFRSITLSNFLDCNAISFNGQTLNLGDNGFSLIVESQNALFENKVYIKEYDNQYYKVITALDMVDVYDDMCDLVNTMKDNIKTYIDQKISGITAPSVGNQNKNPYTGEEAQNNNTTTTVKINTYSGSQWRDLYYAMQKVKNYQAYPPPINTDSYMLYCMSAANFNSGIFDQINSSDYTSKNYYYNACYASWAETCGRTDLYDTTDYPTG